ncbi:MAG: hypothetical protein OXR73_37140 [Myxococcales bacterium]|nr:hypothetical protein [Myxococcales bacterium]
MWARGLYCGGMWLALSGIAAAQAPDRTGGEVVEGRLFDPEVDAEVRGAQTVEVIDDPELADVDEGRIDDPELAGSGEQIEDPELSSSGYSAYGESDSGDFELRGLFRSRLGVDMVWDGPREEVWEVRQLAQLEAILRPSEATTYALGLRLRHATHALRKAVAGDSAFRHEFDAMPVAGYVDTSPEPGVHLRVGYQMHQLGLFDVLSATNVLSVFDMRPGPTVLPEANEIAQLGVRFDWDLTAALSLRAVYLPFFMPNPAHWIESDYRLIDPHLPPPDVAGDIELARLPSRTARARLAQGSLSAFMPDPDLTTPQGALRVTLRGSAGQISLTGVTALERLPVPLLGVSGVPRQDLPIWTYLRASAPDLFDYTRLFVVALDAAAPIGPIQTGIELSYTFDRALQAVVPAVFDPMTGMVAVDPRTDPPLPLSAYPQSEQVDVVQLGLRAEWLLSSLVLAVEGFGAMAMELPKPPASPRWFAFYEQRYLFGGIAYIALSLSPFELQVAVSALNGPTLYVQPRVAYAVDEGVELELGAHVMEGPTPPALASQAMALGGLYDNIDQVYVGIRYAP